MQPALHSTFTSLSLSQSTSGKAVQQDGSQRPFTNSQAYAILVKHDQRRGMFAFAASGKRGAIGDSSLAERWTSGTELVPELFRVSRDALVKVTVLSALVGRNPALLPFGVTEL